MECTRITQWKDDEVCTQLTPYALPRMHCEEADQGDIDDRSYPNDDSWGDGGVVGAAAACVSARCFWRTLRVVSGSQQIHYSCQQYK